MFDAARLEDLPAFRFGHAQDAQAGTGCTAIIAPEGAVCGVDVRGGGPATRETDLLRPENMVEQVHAVVLSGGSAFGLEASSGVMEALAEREVGFEICGQHVPIVVGACLFDLPYGLPAHPDKAMGRAAAEAALAGAPFAQGNVGAGCGATVGKMLAPEAAMKSGFGYAAVREGDVVVAALVAVNALGCVRAADGRWLAGCRDEEGRVMDGVEAMRLSMRAQTPENAAQTVEDPSGSGASRAEATAEAGGAPHDPRRVPGCTPCENTTIGAIVTNAHLTKAQATKVASCCHDAYARAIWPVHTLNDGDTIFAYASGEAAVPSPDLVSLLGCAAMQQAIENAVLSATSAFGLPVARDLG